jgi:hypothetical protein
METLKPRRQSFAVRRFKLPGGARVFKLESKGGGYYSNAFDDAAIRFGNLGAMQRCRDLLNDAIIAANLSAEKERYK